MNLFSPAGMCSALLVLCASSSAFATSGDLLRYRMSGTLEEGGHFSGTFAIDPLADDQQPFDGIARFDVLDANFTLWGTSLFENGITSGSGTTAVFVQSEPAMQQTIGFNLRSDDGLSSATAQLFFKPFTSDAETVVPLIAFSDGYFDGNGQTPITSLTVTRIPEPTGIALAASGIAVLVLYRRHRRVE